jgi:pimeloyl-ACP methyl ester carboxylesterase
MYDQVGCGRSTHLPEKFGDGSFWTIDLFLSELENLLSHLGIQDDYDLLGQSWGGILASELAVRQPTGLKKLILANALASSKQSRHNNLSIYIPEPIKPGIYASYSCMGVDRLDILLTYPLYPPDQ